MSAIPSTKVTPTATDADSDALAGCALRCVAEGEAPAAADESYLFDDPALDAARLAAAAGIVLPRAGTGRAAALLAAGARRVLVGEAALLDGSIVSALAATFGGERVGVHVPGRRFEVTWSFDASSNADFKVMTPSLGAPAWEVLRADGTPTGTQALWWIDAMFGLGASEALLRVDIRDDADLELCAECVERFGDRVWLGPRMDPAPALADWVRLGRVRRLALPPALYARSVASKVSLQGQLFEPVA
jgi:hypothetical protein